MKICKYREWAIDLMVYDKALKSMLLGPKYKDNISQNFSKEVHSCFKDKLTLMFSVNLGVSEILLL